MSLVCVVTTARAPMLLSPQCSVDEPVLMSDRTVRAPLEPVHGDCSSVQDESPSLGTSASGVQSNDGTTSASDRDTEQRDAPPSPAVKKRKVTYYQRRDEIEELKAEIKSLQASLLAAEQAAAVGRMDPLKSMDAPTRAAFYDKSIERNNLKLAGTQAMLSSYNMEKNVGKTPESIPLKSFVQLPADPDKRQETMRAMHIDRLTAAYQFMADRTRGLDLSVPQRHNEQFNFPNGEITVLGFDVTHFDSGHSLRQVYDAFVFFIVNQEISMSTELGVLTIRESEDYGDSTYRQTRFLSCLPEGLEIESNAVMFAACVDGTTDKLDGYAVGFVEYVDEDELYPYRPDKCGRRDMTGAVQFTEIPNVDASRPPVIVLSRWDHVQFRPPTFPMSQEMKAAAQARICQNDDIAFKVMRDRLAMVTPAAAV